MFWMASAQIAFAGARRDARHLRLNIGFDSVPKPLHARRRNNVYEIQTSDIGATTKTTVGETDVVTIPSVVARNADRVVHDCRASRQRCHAPQTRLADARAYKADAIAWVTLCHARLECRTRCPRQSQEERCSKCIFR